MNRYVPVDSRALTDFKGYACRIFAALSVMWVVRTVPGAGQAPGTPPASTAAAVPEVQEPMVPLPLTIAGDPPRVALGARLFQDVRLSGRNTMACATCHQLPRGVPMGYHRPKARTAWSAAAIP